MLYAILVGGLAGWIGSQIIKGHGLGIIGNIIVGVLGGILGNWIFRQIGFISTESFTSTLITSVVGAVVLLFLVEMVRKNR